MRRVGDNRQRLRPNTTDNLTNHEQQTNNNRQPQNTDCTLISRPVHYYSAASAQRVITSSRGDMTMKAFGDGARSRSFFIRRIIFIRTLTARFGLRIHHSCVTTVFVLLANIRVDGGGTLLLQTVGR